MTKNTGVEEILLNRMYVGKYLTMGANIGHEIINLLKADDEGNYIYINPYGTIDKKHTNIKYVLLVRNTGIPYILEIIAKAIIDQRAIIPPEKDIKYGKKSIEEIYSKNKGLEGKIKLVTYKAKKVLRPKGKPLYISFEKKKNDNNPLWENTVYLNEENNYINPMKSSLKMYINNNEQKDFYNKLLYIINSDNWEKESSIPTVKEFIEKPVEWNNNLNNKNNFIDLIDKKDAELTYSNLFAYIFKENDSLLKEFIKKILNIDINKNEEIIDIVREENNIDLLIKTSQRYIVIENKIKSDINGIKENEEDKKDCAKNTKLVDSQLSKYVDYIENKTTSKQNHYFIFAPNYSHITKSYLKKFDCGDKYEIIYYSDIYKFYLEKNITNIPYYKEFLYALLKHINQIDNTLEIEMNKRFIQMINSK